MRELLNRPPNCRAIITNPGAEKQREKREKRETKKRRKMKKISPKDA